MIEQEVEPRRELGELREPGLELDQRRHVDGILDAEPLAPEPLQVGAEDVALGVVITIGIVMMLIDLWQSLQSKED